MVHGSCLCGQVRFELTGPAQFINHCHCSMCRKVHKLVANVSDGGP